MTELNRAELVQFVGSAELKMVPSPNMKEGSGVDWTGDDVTVRVAAGKTVDDERRLSVWCWAS